jgi:FOG: TPR repeat, SEL1 subfamily
MNLPDPILSIIQYYDLDFYGNSRYNKGMRLLESDDKKQAFALLEDAATNADHEDACFEVAKAYLWNLGLTMPNFHKGFQFSQKGHQLGHQLCTELLAICYFRGYGVPPDEKRYHELLQKSVYYRKRWNPKSFCIYMLMDCLNDVFRWCMPEPRWDSKIKGLAKAGDPIALQHCIYSTTAIRKAASMQNTSGILRQTWIAPRHNGQYIMDAIALGDPVSMVIYAKHLEGVHPWYIRFFNLHIPQDDEERIQLATSLRQRAKDAGYFDPKDD